LNGAGQKNIETKTPSWEDELWSYLSSGDGIHCPTYKSCQIRKKKAGCFSENEKVFQLLSEFVDKDELKINDSFSLQFKLPTCPESGRIFELVRRLAHIYVEDAEITHPPVPTNLITHVNGDIPIEVRRVPLKAYRGAVWHLNNRWIVQLNSNDSTARQRFSLYHEIFHILAHSKATPVFKKVGCQREGSFNEMLADHFSAACLVPEILVRKTWPLVKDMNKMTELFDVPVPIMWLASRLMHLT
jgi:hypothetical protein